MQRNLTSPIAGATKQGRKLSPVVLGAALVLATAAGLATWQGLAQRDGARTMESDTAASATSAPIGTVSEDVTPLGGMAELYAEQAAAARTAADTVYIVAAPADAERLLAQLDSGSAVRDALQLPASALRVEWFDSTEAEIHFLTALSEMNTHRGALGAPPVSVTDLRAIGSAATGSTVPDRCGVVVAPADCHDE